MIEKWRDLQPNYIDPVLLASHCDPFEVLGVSREADWATIKRAYHSKVRVIHSDVADPFMKQHNESMMKLVNRAYELLKEKYRGK